MSHIFYFSILILPREQGLSGNVGMSSMFTGEEEVFAFARACSRLVEWKRRNGPRRRGRMIFPASLFLRPLQSLGLGSPSISPKMGQNALGMLAPSDPHVGETGFLDAAGVRTHEPVFGKRRDSSTTVTRHDLSRAHLRAVLLRSSPNQPRHLRHGVTFTSLPIAPVCRRHLRWTLHRRTISIFSQFHIHRIATCVVIRHTIITWHTRSVWRLP